MTDCDWLDGSHDGEPCRRWEDSPGVEWELCLDKWRRNPGDKWCHAQPDSGECPVCEGTREIRRIDKPVVPCPICSHDTPKREGETYTLTCDNCDECPYKYSQPNSGEGGCECKLWNERSGLCEQHYNPPFIDHRPDSDCPNLQPDTPKREGEWEIECPHCYGDGLEPSGAGGVIKRCSTCDGSGDVMPVARRYHNSTLQAIIFQDQRQGERRKYDEEIDSDNYYYAGEGWRKNRRNNPGRREDD